MKSTLVALLSIGATHAARPWLEYPDTLAEVQYGPIEKGGQLPNVSNVVGLPDFDYLAEGYVEGS
jgi:hypothetical protein